MSGSYTGVVPDGTYRVKITDESVTPWRETWHNAQASCGDATEVTVSGNTSTLNLVALAAPGTPGKPTAAAGDQQATVTVAAGSGAAPTSYTVTSAPGGKTCTVTGASGSCTVTGLTNGTAYTFTSTATNSIGTSAVSVASDAVTPNVVPGAPGKPRAAAGDQRATVFVGAGSGGRPSSYTVTSAPGGKTCTVTGANGACTVTGLTNGTPYTFTSTATNSAGTSAASEASNSVTPGVSGAAAALSSNSLIVAGLVAVAAIAAAQADVQGNIELSNQAKPKAVGVTAAAKRVLYGKAKFSVRAGQTKKVKIPLRMAAKKKLRAKKKLTAYSVITVNGVRQAPVKVTLRRK